METPNIFKICRFIEGTVPRELCTVYTTQFVSSQNKHVRAPEQRVQIFMLFIPCSLCYSNLKLSQVKLY